MLKRFLMVCCMMLAFSSCQNPPKKDNAAKTDEQQNMAIVDSSKTADKFKPFYVYTNKGSRLNHFVPSGFMPNGKCIEFNDGWADSCYSEKTCLRISFDAQCARDNEKWAGIYWLNPANNWGKTKGGFNLQGATHLTFWARGEKGGEQIKEFLIGGVSGDYPDTDSVIIGPVILTKEWRQYTIDLRGNDLSYISGGFAWTTSEDVNPDGAIFYLDEIRYE